MPIHGNLGGFIKPGFNPLGPQTEEYTYELYAWGANFYGELGLGNTTYYSSPVQVGALTTWTKVSAGNQFSVAIKNDGTMWSWGEGAFGKLGQGSTTDYSSPVQIGALTTWSQVSAGHAHTLAIKTGGTLWAWGQNTTYGQLGLGDTTNRSSPVQVGALTDWLYVAAGFYSSFAIKTDGTMWSWGGNDDGALGIDDGTFARRSSPVQIGSNTYWASVAGGRDGALAVTTDGKLFSWGLNNSGELGLGDTTYRISPVQVGALTTWAQVSMGRGNYSSAVKTDGTMWTWGKNNFGQLGQNNTTNYSSPVQVGALTTWSKVAAGNLVALAVKTDGTLWAWGDGGDGSLGQGNTLDYSSPVQVGSLTTWGELPYMMSSNGASFALQL
jgi:alpha-tubulin suppressor-like RCC1 family protein